MRRLAIGLGVAALVAVAATARNADEKKPPFQATADEIAKEFKEDAAAAKKKYGTKPLPETKTDVQLMPLEVTWTEPLPVPAYSRPLNTASA